MKMFFIRIFKIITIEQAKSYGLVFHRNVYGDEINYLNCRSIWKDNKGRCYRIGELFNIS